MGSPPPDSSLIDTSEYCRQLESYLCQKNEGHLIRISGPVFDQVRGWAAMGVPLTIALRGVDRYCERYYAKGPKRRPVRIEFCEADILELFDDWRRAIGLPSASDEPARHDRETLPAHVDRVISRLTACRAGGRFSRSFDGLIDGFIRELDRERTRAKHARGDERAALVTRLTEVDRQMMVAAIGELTAEARATHEGAAADEIAPFAPRMAAEAQAAAVRAAFERLVREHFGLPAVAFE
jgi:hypothetical protein